MVLIKATRKVLTSLHSNKRRIMKPLFFFLVIAAVAPFLVEGSHEHTVKGSMTSGHRIVKGSMARCPSGVPIHGFKLKVEADQVNGDDTALNAVRFHCNDGGELDSLEGHFGHWHSAQHCARGKHAIGVEMRIEASEPNDVTGANNIRLICSDFRPVEGAKGGPWGRWIGGTDCNGGYMCGFRSYVQEVMGQNGDDMGMTEMGIMCC